VNDRAGRPKRGLAPDEALETWSDPDLYGELVQLGGSSPPPTNIPSTAAESHKAIEYSRKRVIVEEAFREELRDGAVLCSAIARQADRREIERLTVLVERMVQFWHPIRRVQNRAIVKAAQPVGPPSKLFFRTTLQRRAPMSQHAREAWRDGLERQIKPSAGHDHRPNPWASSSDDRRFALIFARLPERVFPA
jgi:hypothetical protein